jgi:hypothetical protein
MQHRLSNVGGVCCEVVCFIVRFETIQLVVINSFLFSQSLIARNDIAENAFYCVVPVGAVQHTARGRKTEDARP